jgi:hypothetical protein
MSVVERITYWIPVRGPRRKATARQYPDTCLHFVGIVMFDDLSACCTVSVLFAPLHSSLHQDCCSAFDDSYCHAFRDDHTKF